MPVTTHFILSATFASGFSLKHAEEEEWQRQVWEEAGRRDEQSGVVLPCLLHALTLRREDVTKKKRGEVRGRGISAPAPLRPLELDPPPLCQPGLGRARREVRGHHGSGAGSQGCPAPCPLCAQMQPGAPPPGGFGELHSRVVSEACRGWGASVRPR